MAVKSGRGLVGCFVKARLLVAVQAWSVWTLLVMVV